MTMKFTFISLSLVLLIAVFRIHGVSSDLLDDTLIPTGGILAVDASAADGGAEDVKVNDDVQIDPSAGSDVPEVDHLVVQDDKEHVDEVGPEVDPLVVEEVKEHVDEVGPEVDPLVVQEDKVHVDESAPEVDPLVVEEVKKHGDEVAPEVDPLVVQDDKVHGDESAPEVDPLVVQDDKVHGDEVAPEVDPLVVEEVKEHVDEVDPEVDPLVVQEDKVHGDEVASDVDPLVVEEGKEHVDEVVVQEDKEHVDESVPEVDPLKVQEDEVHGDEVAPEVLVVEEDKKHGDEVGPEVDPLVVEEDKEGGDEVVVQELRGGKSYNGAVCTPSLDDLEAGVITMPPPPLDPACKAYFWTASVDEGFVPDVTVESLIVDHKVGEFMIIGPGDDRDVLWVDDTNPMITNVTTPKLFRVLTSNVFSVFLVTNTPTGFKGSFMLRYKPEGFIETTTEPPTIGPTLPTPGPNISSEIVIYLGGKPASDYQSNLTLRGELQAAIAEMAANYSQDNNISLLEEITSDNVVFSLVRECNGAWRDSVDCVQVNTSVAVLTDLPGHYEMTAAHLQDMWNKIDKNDPRLKNIGLHKYVAPDAERSMYIWLGLSLVVLVIFVAILMVVWRVEIWDYKRMISKSESGYSARSSSASTDSAWFPAPEHQLVPPYMENYGEGYVEYEPEFDGPAPPPIKYQNLPTPAANVYNPPPRYGPPPNAFGGAIHFYNNARQNYKNPTFEEDDEDEINASTSNSKGLQFTHHQHNDNSNC